MDFENLVNQHKDAVYRHMVRVCGNHADAEDVLVEALLKAYRHLDQLKEAVAFRAWLATIAGRVCWQLRKREALMPLLQLSELADEGKEIRSTSPSAETQLELSEMKRVVVEAIAALPEPYREVYEIRDLRGLDGDEAAKKLGISRAAMKSRLHRARAMVRQHIDSGLLKSKEIGETKSQRS